MCKLLLSKHDMTQTLLKLPLNPSHPTNQPLIHNIDVFLMQYLSVIQVGSIQWYINYTYGHVIWSESSSLVITMFLKDVTAYVIVFVSVWCWKANSVFCASVHCYCVKLLCLFNDGCRCCHWLYVISYGSVLCLLHAIKITECYRASCTVIFILR